MKIGKWKMENKPLHIPVLRLGKPYTSLDKIEVLAHATGEKLIEVSQVNAGIVRREPGLGST